MVTFIRAQTVYFQDVEFLNRMCKQITVNSQRIAEAILQYMYTLNSKGHCGKPR